MSLPPRRHEPQRRTRALEMMVFLVASAIGVYALGTGLTGLVEPGRGFDLPWLAVASIAIWILFAQMGRVQDAWPRREKAEARLAQPSQRGEDRDKVSQPDEGGGTS
ncbi:MAG: hypothetical protein M3072_16625 [Candidatus Dormibacteraeota bacterium]|nr:hypothetical protein [Candidatus Dormibacteraeota bacterium]